MIIACDVDGVVADLGTVWLERYNRDYNDKLKLTDLLSWNIDMYVKPECGLKIYEYIEDPTIYEDVMPIPMSIAGVLKLRERGHRVVFVTSSTAGAQGAKLKWLRNWGFLKEDFLSLRDYVEAADKSLVRADIMIDDYIENLKAFQGVGIMFTRPWNTDLVWPRRVNWWKEVVDGRIAGL